MTDPDFNANILARIEAKLDRLIATSGAGIAPNETRYLCNLSDDSRITALENRLDRIVARLPGLGPADDARLSQHVTALARRLTALEQHLAAIDNRLDAMEVAWQDHVEPVVRMPPDPSDRKDDIPF
jgi:hypothetical protein